MHEVIEKALVDDHRTVSVQLIAFNRSKKELPNIPRSGTLYELVLRKDNDSKAFGREIWLLQVESSQLKVTLCRIDRPAV